MNENKMNGFLFNICIYTITLYLASLFPFIGRTIVSFFIKTPSISELKADASYLVNIIYPLMGVVTIAAFLFGGYIACYFTGFRVAYKTRAAQSRNKAKTQTIICGIIISFYNIFTGFGSSFSGMFAIQFWYPSAILGSLFGLYDKTNLLAVINNSDIRLNNFVITGLNPIIGIFIVIFAVLLSVAFVYVALRGRFKGEADGLESIKKYVEDIKKESSAE